MPSSYSDWQRTRASFTKMIISLEVLKPRMKALTVLVIYLDWSNSFLTAVEVLSD